MQIVKNYLLLLPLLTAFFSVGQDSLDTALQKRIYTIYQLDQQCREQMKRYYNHQLDTVQFSFATLTQNIRTTDSLNYDELKAIIDRYGFPGYNLVGADYSDAFWNIVQHQDNNPDFQLEVLEKMKAETDRNNASILYYAYLLDRVKVNRGEKQIYGTQLQLNADSTSYEPKPVEDPENLDTRRQEAGLTPIASYIEQMNSNYVGTLKTK